MAQPQKVYLDHHIRREDLLYKRGNKASTPISNAQRHYLTINSLANHKIRSLLCKPDFQRSTSAWTPIECVDLLDSVIHEKVVPSVIMWLGPDGLQYVLDGGHRISVLIAWILDDWGDRRPVDAYRDDRLKLKSDESARKVRELLLKAGIRSYEDHMNAFNKFIPNNWPSSLSNEEQIMAERVSRWEAVDIGYPIQWVHGDYQVAEDSFLKINKTGRRLTDWETTLVENRTSSFVRSVIAVSEIQDSSHCWHTDDSDILDRVKFTDKISNILILIKRLNALFFLPEHILPIKSPNLPLVSPPPGQPEAKPMYLAEIFTISLGKKGKKTETEQLIKQDAKENSYLIVNNGLALLQKVEDAIVNLYGSSPRSLALMPLVYFYSSQGRYVRSLLYGMLFWINAGTDEDIVKRKLLFSKYRGKFEDIVIAYKNSIVDRIARRIGSGTEVTAPTAYYYNGLLRLLISYNGNIESVEFAQDHQQLIEMLGKEKNLTNKDQVDNTRTGQRVFRDKARDSVTVKELLEHSPRCGVCGGRYVPNVFTQVDHITKYTEGGRTELSNARHIHPFCNNRRDQIDEIIQNIVNHILPDFGVVLNSKPYIPEKEPLFKFIDEGLQIEEEDDDESYDLENGNSGEIIQ